MFYSNFFIVQAMHTKDISILVKNLRFFSSQDNKNNIRILFRALFVHISRSVYSSRFLQLKIFVFIMVFLLIAAIVSSAAPRLLAFQRNSRAHKFTLGVNVSTYMCLLVCFVGSIKSEST